MAANPKVISSAAPTVKLLINGQLVESKSQHWKDVINPATQEVLARVPFATQAELELAVTSAKAAFKTWRKTPVSQRVRVFLKLQQLVRDNLPLLASTLTTEHGKTLPDAEGDVARGLEVLEHAIAMNTLQQGDFLDNVASGIDIHTAREPLGVCAGITPFNFPAMIPLWMFPMAIVLGNTFILKPSEQDPLTPMILADLAMQAGLPPGVLNVIHGGKEMVDGICTHPDIRAIQFVGSTAVGTHIYHLGSTHGKRVQANMGAKNHAVVMPDANKEQALNALLGAGFGAAGQRCMAVSVALMVGETKNWIPDLVAKAKTLKTGAGTDKGVDVCPVISTAAKHRIEGFIQEGIKEGAKLELDGRSPNVPGYEKGNFIAPTIFSGVKSGMSIYQQEIFGPVLSVANVDTLDEAIAFINDNPMGNGAAILTSSGAAARKFESECECGQIGVNVPIPTPVGTWSFTGSRGSKLGVMSPNGQEIVAFYTQTKTVLTRWFDDSSSSKVNTTITLK